MTFRHLIVRRLRRCADRLLLVCHHAAGGRGHCRIRDSGREWRGDHRRSAAGCSYRTRVGRRSFLRARQWVLRHRLGWRHRPPRTEASGTRSMAASSPSMPSPVPPRSKAASPCPRTRRRMPPRMNGVEPATEGAVGADLTDTDPEGAAAPADDSVGRQPPISRRRSEQRGSRRFHRRVDPAQFERTDSGSCGSRRPPPLGRSATGEMVDPCHLVGTVPTPAPVDAAPVAPAPSDAPVPSSTAQPRAGPNLRVHQSPPPTLRTRAAMAPPVSLPRSGAPETLGVSDDGAPSRSRGNPGRMAAGQLRGCRRLCARRPDRVDARRPADPTATPRGHDSGNENPRRRWWGRRAQRLVDFALQFKGHPYVYAGEGP